MIDNYIEAPKFIINMLKEQYSTREGDLDLQKLNPETRITAYETVWSETRVSFDTYDGAPASVFAILCEQFPKEDMSYFFYSHDLTGNSMLILNKDGEAVLDPEYEAMLEAQEEAMYDDDSDEEYVSSYNAEYDEEQQFDLSSLFEIPLGITDDKPIHEEPIIDDSIDTEDWPFI